MNKSWPNSTGKVLLIILAWWAIIAGAIALTIRLFPITPTFPYYEPDLRVHYNRFWSTFAHFDGIHYLRIATSGRYPDGGEVAFFPLYSFLGHGLLNIGIDKLSAGLLISNSALVIALLILLYIYPKSRWKLALLLLSFPMSFFFAMVYTESLYLLLFAISLFFIQRKQYFFAAATIAALTGTRFVGIAMGLYLLAFMWKKVQPAKLIALLTISFSGLLGYMTYLWQVRGDALAFIHVQPQFGMGRSGGEIILLPQVLFRYGKMVVLADPNSLVYWRAVAELVLFLLVTYVLLKVWRKLSIAERLYSLTVLLIPTLSGTLSSYPRYILVAIPLFAALSESLSSRQTIVLAAVQTCLLIGAIALFAQGLFIA